MEDYIKEIFDTIRTIDYVKPSEIPNIDLYMDQVTTFMDQHLESSKRYEDDKLLTKTMINNYTKNNLLPSPDKKKYSKDHMFLLIFIYYMKSVLSISDIQSIMNPLTEKFFGKDKDINLETVYQEIFQIEEIESKYVTKDLVRKLKESKDTFSGIEEDEDREFLKVFSFVCMLIFDVHMKKQIIEKMIDEYQIFKMDDKGKSTAKVDPKGKQDSKGKSDVKGKSDNKGK